MDEALNIQMKHMGKPVYENIIILELNPFNKYTGPLIRTNKKYIPLKIVSMYY